MDTFCSGTGCQWRTDGGGGGGGDDGEGGGCGHRTDNWHTVRCWSISVPAGHSVSVSLTCKHQAKILTIKVVTTSQVSLAPSGILMLSNY